MRLIRSNDGHPFQRARECNLISDCDTIVVARDHLIVVRIGPFDQPSEHGREGRTKSEVVIASCDLELLVGGKQSTDLLQCLGRHDQIAGRRTSRLDWHFHFCKPMAIRGNHPHGFGFQLPQYAIEDGPTFLRADSKGRVGNQLLKVARANSPAFVETNTWKAGKFVSRQAEDLEVRPATVQCHALFPGSSNLHWGWRELTSNLSELFRWNRDRASCFDIRSHLGAHCDIEIRTG